MRIAVVAAAVAVWMVTLASGAHAVRNGFELQPTPRPEGAAPRRLDFRPGEPLLLKLQPSDRLLEIVDAQPEGQWAMPPGETLISSMTKAASTVCVLRVLSIEGQLRPSGDWIDSRVTAEVLELLKDVSQSGLSRNSTISFVIPGGEIRVDDKIVRAVKSEAGPLVTEQTYLVFMVARDGGLWTNHLSSFLLDNDDVVPLSRTQGYARLLPNSRVTIRNEVVASSRIPPK